MRRFFAVHSLLVIMCFATSSFRPAAAQDAYAKGYHDGYNDQFPTNGTPSIATPYGQGFRSGQDDADDDDAAAQRSMNEIEHPPQLPSMGTSGVSDAPMAAPSPLVAPGTLPSDLPVLDSSDASGDPAAGR